MNVSAFSAAQAGLAAASATLDSVARSVAQRSVADPAVRVTISDAARAGGGDEVRDTVTRMSAAAAYRANLKTLEAADEMNPASLIR